VLYTAQQLVTKVRKRLKDLKGQAQGNTWTDDEIVEFLNDEQENLVRKIIMAGEDYFATFKDLDFTANVADYPLFDGFLLLRAVTYQGGVDPTQMIESRLIEGVEGSGGIASQTESQYYYSLFGDNLEIAPTPGQTLAAQARLFFIRMPGPILLETIASSPAADQLQFASTNAPPEGDLYVDTLIESISGTGAGQRRKISAYTVGRIATVSSPFNPALDSTTLVGTISRIPAPFQHQLVYGAAIRAKVDNEENPAGLAALYNDGESDMYDFIERRTGGQRGPIPWDPDDGI